MTDKALALTTIQDLMSVGQVLSQSGFFSDSRGQAQAVAKIIAGQEMGFGPMASMTGINIIKGRVTISANLLAAAIKRSGKYTYKVTKHSDAECAIEFFEDGESIGISEFTMQDAQKAGLGGDNWKKYPRNMLFARALSNGARWHCPDILGGPVYTPDEFDIPVNEDGDAIIEGEVVEVPAPEPDELIGDLQEVGGEVTGVKPPSTNGNGNGKVKRFPLTKRTQLKNDLARDNGQTVEEVTDYLTRCLNAKNADNRLSNDMDDPEVKAKYPALKAKLDKVLAAELDKQAAQEADQPA